MKFLTITISDENSEVIDQFKIINDASISVSDLENPDFFIDNDASDISEVIEAIKKYFNKKNKGV